MPTLCRICSRTNPAEAVLLSLSTELSCRAQQRLGPDRCRPERPLPRPFHFPTGEVCQNYRPSSPSTVKRIGKRPGSCSRTACWTAFLGGLGRGDLVAVATQAAAQSDPDRGRRRSAVATAVSANSGHQRQRSCQAAPVATCKLGKLKPGKDQSDFSIRLDQRGASPDCRQRDQAIAIGCRWSRRAARPTAHGAVRAGTEHIACGSSVPRLPAGKHHAHGKAGDPYHNAGSVEIARDLRGARSCRSRTACWQECPLAPAKWSQKAKNAVDATGELFFRGQGPGVVSAPTAGPTPWKASPPRAKAAVQQFLEALGLTRPADRGHGPRRPSAFRAAPGEDAAAKRAVPFRRESAHLRFRPIVGSLADRRGSRGRTAIAPSFAIEVHVPESTEQRLENAPRSARQRQPALPRARGSSTSTLQRPRHSWRTTWSLKKSPRLELHSPACVRRGVPPSANARAAAASLARQRRARLLLLLLVPAAASAAWLIFQRSDALARSVLEPYAAAPRARDLRGDRHRPGRP